MFLGKKITGGNESFFGQADIPKIQTPLLSLRFSEDPAELIVIVAQNEFLWPKIDF